jgi:hypothetical protein
MINKSLLAILGSPHVNGITSAMLDCAIHRAEKVGYHVTKINLYEKNLLYCKGCRACMNTNICIDILEHRNERGKAAEAITNKIIEEQKINVDTIAGATNSSTVIKKAVENALKSGQ